MMKRIGVAALLVMLAWAFAACGAVSAFTGSSNLTTVSALWSDVPRMDGLAPSEMEFPLYGKVLMRTLLNQVGSAGQNSGDWIVFSTSKSPDDVKAFYTNARMTASGWEASEKSTCFSGSEQGIAQVGALCVFMKQESSKQVGLMIIAAHDDQTKQTNVLFIRVEELATPSPSK